MVAKENGNKKSISKDPLDTPVMRQYLDLKEKNPECLLFFRMGDFYELFLDDAVEAAPLMDIALTRRQSDIPMAGVPYHSAETYLSRLLSAGKKVAIAEQKQDPTNPKLMSREVVRILSGGTLIEENYLSSSASNYLMAITSSLDGLAFAEVSTGEFFALEVSNSVELRDVFFQYSPREVLIPSAALQTLHQLIPEIDSLSLATAMEGWKCSASEGLRKIKSHLAGDPRSLGFEDPDSAALAAVSLIYHYIGRAFPSGFTLSLPVFRRFKQEYMTLDEQTIRNLDLLENVQQSGRTLHAVMDFCKTAPGKRHLRNRLLQPFALPDRIRAVQNKVSFLFGNDRTHSELKSSLSGMADLGRIASRIQAGRGAPRDLSSFVVTIQKAKQLEDLPENLRPGIPQSLYDLAVSIEEKICQELPATLGTAPLLKIGVHEELDRAREASEKGSRWILELEEDEKKRTGIANLKIRYNRIVGYYIEVSKGQLASVPDDYQRKQTLVNGERFTSEKLRSIEQEILQADDIISRIENEQFALMCEKIIELSTDIRSLMQDVAELDVLSSMAEAARQYKWTCPKIIESAPDISGGRHPVIEKYLDTGEDFIRNDLLMSEERRFALITGPNMAGKSTYLRQVALIQLLFQIGSFVPAEQAKLPVMDRIFTRIGAQDNLTKGESTFYVEMLETARILNQSTEHSLVIMDEVGRGTSTYDGLSIAWAIVEYLSGPVAPYVLFATHYHELTVLGGKEGIFNLTMEVYESEGISGGDTEKKVIFLHKVKEGAADKSYGIHVARLAGLPAAVIDRAEEKLDELEENRKKNPPRRKSYPENNDSDDQFELFSGV